MLQRLDIILLGHGVDLGDDNERLRIERNLGKVIASAGGNRICRIANAIIYETQGD
jgi:hypothetical protein